MSVQVVGDSLFWNREIDYRFAAVGWVISGTLITGYGDLIPFEEWVHMSAAIDLIGLILITIGGVGAALCTPSPRYNSDGSVSLSGEMDKNKRISIHHRQRWFPRLLVLIGIGAACQFVAALM